MKIYKKTAIRNLQKIIDVIRTTRGKPRDLLVQFVASLTLHSEYLIHLESLRALDDQLRASCLVVLTAALQSDFGLIDTWGVFEKAEIYVAATSDGKRKYDERQAYWNCPSRKKVQQDMLVAIGKMAKARGDKNDD